MQHHIFLINFIILGQYILVITSFILCSFPKSKRHAYEISTKIVPLEPHQCYFFLTLCSQQYQQVGHTNVSDGS